MIIITYAVLAGLWGSAIGYVIARRFGMARWPWMSDD